MKTAIYLRKSRQDEESEKNGVYDTLGRHRSTLLSIAKEKKLNVIEIKEEVVSGESISYRPKMLELLEEVKSNKYDAVLVMDIDRLGRGNMQDQGLILDTFKTSRTKIITPRKIYDLNNEFDEEYSEFEAFMARKELKLITRRLQRGRVKSVEEGRYIAQSPPYGYKFTFDENGKKLMVIDDEKAEVVKIIYDMYINGKKGADSIVNYLNSLGYKTSTGLDWYTKAVRDILKNKTYCGYVIWFKEERRKSKRYLSQKQDQIESKGLHDAIISEDMWNKAQKIRSSRKVSPTKSNQELTNPLAGLVICRECGYTMVGKFSTTKNGYIKYMVCTHCKGISGIKLEVLEKEILNSLQNYLAVYKMQNIIGNNPKNDNISSLRITLSSLEKESSALNKQKENLHDLLERGIYDVDTYLDRSRILADKIKENVDALEKVKKDIKLENEKIVDLNEIIYSIENVLELYGNAETANQKNNLLKSVLDKIVYYKEPRKKKVKFEIDLKIKLS